jgi:uncharacterized protein
MPSTLNPTCPLCGLRYTDGPLLELHIRRDHLQRSSRAEPDHDNPGDARASQPRVRGPIPAEQRRWNAAGCPPRRSGRKTTMRTISVSLPVRNLQVSKAFFAELGFTLSAEASGDDIACMIVGRNIYLLLVAEDRFSDSVGGELSRASASPGFVTTLSADSEQEVDETVARAIAAGGEPWPIMEERPVYSGSFQDLDGHVWQLSCPRHLGNLR